MSVSPVLSVVPKAAEQVEPLLVIDRVCKEFATADGRVTAVDHVSLDVRPGEFVSIIGPSGCGKSTLFHIVGGLTTKTSGRVTINGEPIDGPHPAVGMVFQEESTFPWRTVIENVAFPLEVTGVPKAVQLSERILVMTYRPGRVKRVITVDLPRPRTSAILSSEAFGRYVAEIWADLREEASRGMLDTER
jgi:ABC-type nitrate/sulfonate/bicarbonate transport system ATPase subunit